MNNEKNIIFKTRAGLKCCMNNELYEKVLDNDEDGYTYLKVEEYIVAGEYFPQIMQFIIIMMMMINGYTSFINILLINMVVGLSLTLIWNNSHLYRIEWLSKLSLILGNFIFRLCLHILVIGILSFTYFNDWKILLFNIIAGIITQFFKSWFSGYVYTLKHNNDIAKYCIDKFNKTRKK